MTVSFIDAPRPAPDLDYTGRHVKVGFEVSDPESGAGEWMWVTFISNDPTDRCAGCS